MRSVLVALGMIGVLIAGLPGCAYEYAPVRVDVRDRASHEPIAGAMVTISNTHTINPRPPEPVQGTTGEDGSVTLDVAIYNDLLLRVIGPTHLEHVFSAEHPVLVGPSRWFGPVKTKDGSTPTIEIRLRAPLSQLPEPE